MVNWDALKVEWETTDISLADLATKHDVKLGTLKSRKSREKWLKGATQTDATGNPEDATVLKVDASTEGSQQSAVSSQKGERKRGGNPNPSYSFPKHNKAAEKHGFYSKVIPQELQELFDEIEDAISTENMLWDQIKVQYMAIMRAQSIMFVESKDEMIKELKKRKDTEWGEEVEYEFQFAWERQAQFLNAQSRAISELRSLIEQFETAADKTDKRRLELEQMRLNINKTKLDIEAAQKEDGDKVTKIVIVDDIPKG